MISKSKYNAHTEPILKRLNLLRIGDSYDTRCLQFYYLHQHRMLPTYFNEWFISNNIVNNIHGHYTRQHSNIHISHTRLFGTRNRLKLYMPSVLNKIPQCVLSKIYTHSMQGFKLYTKNYLLSKYSDTYLAKNCYVCRN